MDISTSILYLNQMRSCHKGFTGCNNHTPYIMATQSTATLITPYKLSCNLGRKAIKIYIKDMLPYEVLIMSYVNFMTTPGLQQLS